MIMGCATLWIARVSMALIFSLSSMSDCPKIDHFFTWYVDLCMILQFVNISGMSDDMK